LVGVFSFAGETTLVGVWKPALWWSLVSVLSLFLASQETAHSAVLLVVVLAISALFVRRLRNAGFHGAWVFLAVVPLFGWVALAVLLAQDRSTRDFSKKLLAGAAGFLAIFFIFLSLVSTTTSVENLQEPTAVVSETPQHDDAVVVEEEPDPAEAAIVEPDQEVVVDEGAGQTEQVLVDAAFDELVANLRVEPEFIGGYDRSLFRHWSDADGDGCDTRREVLIAESLTPVSVGSGCSLSGGTWYSAFDGVTTTDASSFDVDHMVPLAEAWRSGAHAWDSGTRDRFANDLGNPHSLIAVSASSNRSKGDKDISRWLPPDRGFHCTYIEAWVSVKAQWELSVDEAELAAIQRNYAGCD
jgi:uncharacterized membrane protein YhaH (DUF805 family)